MKTYSLLELAQQIGATIRGNADVVVSNIAPLDKAEKHQLTFISNAKFREKLAHSKAGILVVSEADVEFCSPESNLLIVKDPYVAYAKLAQYMDTTPKAASGIAESAVISEAVLGKHFTDKTELTAYALDIIKQKLQENQKVVVLAKGSRSMKMEETIYSLKDSLC